MIPLYWTFFIGFFSVLTSWQLAQGHYGWAAANSMGVLCGVLIGLLERRRP